MTTASTTHSTPTTFHGTPLTGTPTRLADGTWGVKIAGQIAIYVDDESVTDKDRVRVTTRSGDTWIATITEIIKQASGHGPAAGRVAIVRTTDRPDRETTSTTRKPRTYRGGYAAQCDCCPRGIPARNCLGIGL